jgi:hypothetical protein
MPEWVKTHWPKYVEGREAVGAKAHPSEWRVAKSIFVADDEATAKRYALQEGGPYHFYFKQLVHKLVSGGGRSNLFKTNPDTPDSDLTPDYVTQRLVLAGTVNFGVPRKGRRLWTTALCLPRLDGSGPWQTLDGVVCHRGDATRECGHCQKLNIISIQTKLRHENTHWGS